MVWFLLFIALINFIIGFFVLIKNRKDKINIFFVVLSFASALWVFNNFMTGVSTSPIFWLRGAYAWGSMVVSSGLVWVLYLTKSKYATLKTTIIYLLACIFFIFSYSGHLIIDQVNNVYIGRFEGSTGPLFIFYSLFFLILGVTILIKLFTSFLHSRGVIRSQFFYILLGSFLYMGISITVSFILPLFNYLKLMFLDSISSIFFVAAIAYAITRYRFLDVKFIIKRSTVFALIVFLITSLYVLILFILGKIFEDLLGTQSLIITGLISGILIAIGFDPIKNWLQNITDKFLFSKEYNPNILLSEISNISTSTLDLHQILKNFSKKLTDAFHAEKIGIILINNNRMNFTYNYGFDKKSVEAFLKSKSKFLLKYFNNPNDIYVIPELRLKYEKGEYKPKDTSVLDFMDKISVNLIMPLYTKDKIVGIMALGNKKSGDPYSAQDLQVLQIIVKQISIALENASLYDQVIDLNVNLQNKVKIQTAEITEKNVRLQKLLEMKDDFMHIASHQLRTPLTALVGLLEMQETGDFERLKPEKATEMKHNIFLSAMRLRNIVNDLLKAAEAETGLEVEFEQIDVKELIYEAINTLKPEYDKSGLFIKFKSGNNIPKITGSSRYLREVFMNLIHNAQRYTKLGGANISLDKDGDKLIFTITDTGIGVTKEEQRVLFTKFTRGRRAIQFRPDGSGLGLFIIKNIIEAHKGTIELSSEGENKGTTVKVILPIIQINRSTKLK